MGPLPRAVPDVRSRRVAAWEWLSSSYGRLRDWGGEPRRWQLGSAYAYLVHSRLRRDALGNCTHFSVIDFLLLAVRIQGLGHAQVQVLDARQVLLSRHGCLTAAARAFGRQQLLTVRVIIDGWDREPGTV